MSDGQTEPAVGGGYSVSLPTFEGPLDLLLHLIQEHEIDIRDIPIAFVAQKYREYLTLMSEIDIDVASEYLVMAATLAHIKSKMLLPTPPIDQDDPSAEQEADPRAELVRRLLEYQKYKLAAEQLGGRSVLGRDVFARGTVTPESQGLAPLEPLGVFKLLDAFQVVLTRSSRTIDHQVEFERISITERIHQLVDRLRERQRMAFEDLFEGQHTRADLIVTFLALLEMTRLRMTRVFQEGPLEPIHVELALLDDEAHAAVDALAEPIFGGAPAGAEAISEPAAESDAGRPAHDAEPNPESE